MSGNYFLPVMVKLSKIETKQNSSRTGAIAVPRAARGGRTVCSFLSLTRSHFSSSSSGSIMCIVGSLTAGLGSDADGVGAISTGASLGAGTEVGAGVGMGIISVVSSTSLLSSATGAHGPLSPSPRSS